MVPESWFLTSILKRLSKNSHEKLQKKISIKIQKSTHKRNHLTAYNIKHILYEQENIQREREK